MVNFYYDPFSYILDTEYTGQRNSSNGTGILEHSRVQPTVFSNYIPYGNSCHQNVPCQQTYFNSSNGYAQHINSHQNYQHPNYFPDLQPLALHYQPYQPQFKASRLFTTEQIFAMEQKFKVDCFISPEEAIAFGEMIGLTKSQILSCTYQNSYRHPQHILTQFPSSQSSFPNYQQPHYQPYQPPLPVQKKRTVFTVDQLTLLEEAFQKNDKITPEEMRTLMKQTGLSNAQIRTWFNNRRQRKKQENGRKLIIQSVKDKFSF
ncbi:hypothetical protein GCK72_004573 [Caenorhabditis remanei]|uniref:Homeobox domain-containing protein n=1 Tax=Caenorhabditis remanei TaxID=31234 RepID=A0A6A5HCQ1_CAERE|nr:hypothetical protein GCK72_004573 [Caenorhabditis remanei]KAF1764624.1 hypothetical protein GCK72_004573 [Caenorhabditis remanei]